VIRDHYAEPLTGLAGDIAETFMARGYRVHLPKMPTPEELVRAWK
jgi:hypothetical protein